MDRSRFTELLKQAGLNQLELCEKIGITKNTVSNWNKEETYPLWLEDYLYWQITKAKISDLKSFLDEFENL